MHAKNKVPLGHACKKKLWPQKTVHHGEKEHRHHSVPPLQISAKTHPY